MSEKIYFKKKTDADGTKRINVYVDGDMIMTISYETLTRNSSKQGIYNFIHLHNAHTTLDVLKVREVE